MRILPPTTGRCDLHEGLAARLRGNVDLRRASPLLTLQVIGRGLLLDDGDQDTLP
ncbi:MAG: hypothetical protein ABI634_09960 [Acidobacteriota bacterium]